MSEINCNITFIKVIFSLAWQISETIVHIVVQVPNWHRDSLGTTYWENLVSHVKFKMAAIFFKMAAIPGNHSCFYYIACRA